MYYLSCLIKNLFIKWLLVTIFRLKMLKKGHGIKHKTTYSVQI